MFFVMYTPKGMRSRLQQGSNGAFERNDTDILESPQPLGPSLEKNWNWPPKSGRQGTHGSLWQQPDTLKNKKRMVAENRPLRLDIDGAHRNWIARWGFFR